MDKQTYRIAGALGNVVDTLEDIGDPSSAYAGLVDVAENYDTIDIAETFLMLDEDDQRSLLALFLEYLNK